MLGPEELAPAPPCTKWCPRLATKTLPDRCLSISTSNPHLLIMNTESWIRDLSICIDDDEKFTQLANGLWSES